VRTPAIFSPISLPARMHVVDAQAVPNKGGGQRLLCLSIDKEKMAVTQTLSLLSFRASCQDRSMCACVSIVPVTRQRRRIQALSAGSCNLCVVCPSRLTCQELLLLKKTNVIKSPHRRVSPQSSGFVDISARVSYFRLCVVDRVRKVGVVSALASQSPRQHCRNHPDPDSSWHQETWTSR
jgi:hypothetical protein